MVPTTVRDMMRRPLPSVSRTETVVSAARRLRAHRVPAVPVCDDGGGFLGMLSAGDIIDRCVADGQDPRAMTSGSLIEGPGPCVDPDDVFGSTLMSLILAQAFPMLPVVLNGRLIGMLTIDDIAGYLLTIDADQDLQF